MNLTISNRQGKHLSVQVYGQGNAPAIIFSNSLGTDHGMWESQVKTLQDHYTVITYDTRGHGQSEVIADTTLQNLGEDVVDILDRLSIERAHVCGISMGGITALWLGLHYPDRFYSMTIANSAAKIGTAEAWQARAEAVQQSGLSELVKTTHSRWFSTSFDYQHDALAQRTIQSLAQTPAQGYANACLALAEADLGAEIAQITIPTLIIAGAADPVTTVADGVFMQQQIATSELFVIEASHLSNIEQPEDFTQAFSKFIGSIQ